MLWVFVFLMFGLDFFLVEKDFFKNSQLVLIVGFFLDREK